MTFTLGRHHGSTGWVIIHGADATRRTHRDFYNARKFRHEDRTFAEIVVMNRVAYRKRYSTQGLDQDSSSTSASSDSSMSSSSLSSANSTTSASSGTSESSSSSVNSTTSASSLSTTSASSESSP